MVNVKGRKVIYQVQRCEAVLCWQTGRLSVGK
jgi:hypothetical protein